MSAGAYPAPPLSERKRKEAGGTPPGAPRQRALRSLHSLLRIGCRASERSRMRRDVEGRSLTGVGRWGLAAGDAAGSAGAYPAPPLSERREKRPGGHPPEPPGRGRCALCTPCFALVPGVERSQRRRGIDRRCSARTSVTAAAPTIRSGCWASALCTPGSAWPVEICGDAEERRPFGISGPRGAVPVVAGAAREEADGAGRAGAKFEAGRQYREREINEVLDAWHTFGDHTRLRRDLCDAGLLERKEDGSEYWRAGE